MKSRRLVGFLAGLAVGVVLVGSALVVKIPSNGVTGFISMLNIPAGLLTLSYHHLFHPTESFLKGVFYCFLIMQWSLGGLFVGWILDSVAARRRKKKES